MKRTGMFFVLILCFAVIMMPETASAAKKPAKVAISQITTAQTGQEGEVTLTWGQTSCSGYQIEYADNSKFTGSRTWTGKGKSVITKQIKCLEPGSVYWFRVRAYAEDKAGKTYGAWSAAKKKQAHRHCFVSGTAVEPGCGSAGSQEYVCSGCTASYSVKLTPLRHNYKGKVTLKANCKRDGEKTYTCTLCGDAYTEKIAKTTEHKPKKKDGKTVCAVCGKVLKGAGGGVKKAAPSRAAKKAKASKPKTRQQRNLQAREAAVSWAVAIAKDNSFHYGRSKWAHHHGCYFCGTNQKKGSPKRRGGASVSQCEKTYCCNPFVTAAYHHGAGATEVNCKYASKRINLANDRNKALKNSKAFKRVTKPRKVTSLKVGDILLTPSHAMLYAGDGKVVHAAHHDNGKKDAYWNSSIVCGSISDRHWRRTTKIYRYCGTGKF